MALSTRLPGSDATRPGLLRVEHIDEPLGINVRSPRLSWQLPTAARGQLAYRIRAGGWDSGRVESSRSVLVPYAGPVPASGQRVSWTVKVWTDAGESEWSEPGWWETGLLGPADWQARWIEPPVGYDRRHPVHVFRHDVTLPARVTRARLYATAHGVYEFFINGCRVGDMELTPGYTSYASLLDVQTFDVTALLGPGRAVLGATVSDGWFRGQCGYFRRTGVYGTSVALLAQLHIQADDGSELVVGTGADWRVGVGPVVAADLFEGQRVDDTRADPWDPHADTSCWADVQVVEHDFTRLRSSPAPPARRVEEVHPVDITRPAQDRQVVDLGQNINGWVRIRNLGPAGTTLTLTHGEALDADGDVTLANVTVDPADLGRLCRIWDLRNLSSPLQVDEVRSAGAPAEVFEPRHTVHGFRYVRVEGHPEGLDAGDVTGVFVHSDLRRTGWFECSDERVNRLHEAVVRSFRGNACHIPTDCPTRERAGWTGDWQLFVPTAAFLYDVAGFSVKWLRDLAAEQRSDGVVENCVPEPNRTDDENYPFPPGSAGWGDAAVVVPWEIYRVYDDVDVLGDQWLSMARWVDYAARSAREGQRQRVAVEGVDATKHEPFLWDTGFHWGEWLEPGDSLGDDLEEFRVEHARRDPSGVATAYLHHSSRLLAQIAGVLGRENDARRYRRLSDRVKVAWQAAFVGPRAILTPDSQAAYVRALAFDLVPEELRTRCAARLVALVRAAGGHLGTGFLATPYLLPVLADTGYADIAYELLLQDTQPSWLAMIDHGATTMWELWEGLDEHGVARGSLNHYSKGAVASFLHQYVAGIRPPLAPGYRRMQIAPLPGGGLTWARAVHECPYGQIEVAWAVRADEITVDVSIPSGTEADVRMPDGRVLGVGPGSARFRGAARPQEGSDR